MDSITALGIVINNRPTATDHISCVLTACSSLLYALRVLHSHGLPKLSVKDVFWATVFLEITYCLPAWFGFCTAADSIRLDSLLHRCVKQGFWSPSDTLSICAIAVDIEDTPDLRLEFIRCQRHIGPHVDDSCFWNVPFTYFIPGQSNVL